LFKQVRDFEGATIWRRKLASIVKRGDFVALLALSLYSNPFITVAWMRRGRFNWMTVRDWRIFFASWIIGNAWRTLACFGGVRALETLWGMFK
jgi:hypothetical protein